MKNMSLGMKISLGFVILIIIACALGIMAIFNMNKVATQSTMLAQEYVPEVDMAVELRNASNRTMYAMKEYGLTENKTFYENGLKGLKAVESALEKGASEQAASIEETSSSMEEMSSMTKKNAENAGQADTLMKDANQVVKSANESMEHLTRSMEDIAKASDETSKIIKTIDEIAFQTNLLALNAAVEAARAGERPVPGLPW